MAKDAPNTSVAVPANEPAPYALSVDKQLTDTLLFLALLFGIFYFLLIRPQAKQQKAHQMKIGGIKKGSRVITAGGVHGVVAKVEDDVVHVDIAPNVRIKVHKPSIGEVLDDGATPGGTANDN